MTNQVRGPVVTKHPGSTKTAVLYARVSSKDQEREGFSIPAQQKALRTYAQDQHLTIVREFVDIETAKHAGRAGFGEMIGYLKTNADCGTILVEKTDRLYRNIRDWIIIDDLKLVVHFVKESAIVSPDSRSSEKFMHGIKVLMAKNYIDNLSEEVKKGLLEKAAQGHWPTVAPVGYVNNRETHRIDVDPVRGPLVAQAFECYASGAYSLNGLRQKAKTIGLRHPRSDQPLTKSELHRILHNPIYTGDFVWLSKPYRGSHTALITREVFDDVQAVFAGRPRSRYPKQRHAFMGLLTCARCGCSMTAEMKKGKYVYYRCTGFRGACGNTYIREEKLAELLGTAVQAVQIPTQVANDIAVALRGDDGRADQQRAEAVQRLEQREQTIRGKLDRGYDDYVSGRISEDFWTRKSEQWEEERRTTEAELARLARKAPGAHVTGEKILELAKTAYFRYQQQPPAEKRRLLETLLSNCTFDRGSLCPTYSKPFDLLVRGNETGDWLGDRDSNPDNLLQRQVSYR
jgi:site-specific DNA recombinase